MTKKELNKIEKILEHHKWYPTFRVTNEELEASKLVNISLEDAKNDIVKYFNESR